MSDYAKESEAAKRLRYEPPEGSKTMERCEDEDAFRADTVGAAAEAIVARYEKALLRYAARLLNDADAARDVVQEAFIRFFRRWTPEWTDDGRLRQWLYRTTHNAAIDHIRRERRRRDLHERDARERAPAAVPDAPERMEEADRHRLVLAFVAQLDPSEREVLLLRLQEGLSYAEIARATGRRVGTVGCLLHTATRKLAERLRQAHVIGT